MALYQDVSDYLKKWESFTPVAKWDVNAYRLGYGSDTITLPDGTYRKVKAGDKTTKELADKDLQRRIKLEFEPKVRNKVGEPYYTNLQDSAKVALISVAYNYGNLTKPAIVDAARSGNPKKIADAIVTSTVNDNKGTKDYNGLRRRRMDEANYILSNLKNMTALGVKETIKKAGQNPISTTFITAGLIFGTYLLIKATTKK